MFLHPRPGFTTWTWETFKAASAPENQLHLRGVSTASNCQQLQSLIFYPHQFSTHQELGPPSPPTRDISAIFKYLYILFNQRRPVRMGVCSWHCQFVSLWKYGKCLQKQLQKPRNKLGILREDVRWYSSTRVGVILVYACMVNFSSLPPLTIVFRGYYNTRKSLPRMMINGWPSVAHCPVLQIIPISWRSLSSVWKFYEQGGEK